MTLFPINSTGGKEDEDPNHWTLLVYDATVQRWDFFNSKLPRRKKSDPYLHDALRVKSYILDKMKKTFNGTFAEDVEVKQPNIFDNLTHEDYTMPLYGCVNCPQQLEENLDCGVYVCNMMERLASRQPLKKTISDGELGEYKVQLVTSLVADYDI